MGRVFLWSLIVVAMVAGSPYAGLVINMAMGPWTGVGANHDGTTTHTRFDRSITPPAFVPVPRAAQVVQASLSVGGAMPGGFGLIDLAVRAPVDEIRDHARRHLEGHGFEVIDLGIGGLNAASAALLGHAGSLIGKRPSTDDVVTVSISTESGWIFPARNVQVSWRKLSEWPKTAPPP